MKKAMLTMTVLFQIGCGQNQGSSEMALQLQSSADAPVIYSGVAWVTPVTSALNESDTSPTALLEAFTDSNCTVAAPGTLSADQNPVAVIEQEAEFTGVMYQNSAHLDETIYLKTTTAAGSVCEPDSITVRMPFTAGQGYVRIRPEEIGPRVSSIWGTAVTLDSAERVVVAGAIEYGDGSSTLMLWRILPDGALDTAFGTGGYVLFQPGGTGAAGSTNYERMDRPTDIKIDNQGRYVVSGSSINAAGGYELVLWRFLEDGDLDTTFDGKGWTSFQAGGLGAAGASNAAKRDISGGTNTLRIDSSNRIVVAGSSLNSNGGMEAAIWRFLDSGASDVSFAGDGAATFQNNGLGASGAANETKYDRVMSMKIDSLGRYVMTGLSRADDSGSLVPIWRYNSDGTLDNSFGGGAGYVAYSLGAANYAYAIGVDIDSAGRVNLAFTSQNTDGGTEVGALRILSTGALDTTFGSGAGYVILREMQTGFGGTASSVKRDRAGAFMLDHDGRIVIAGSVTQLSGETSLAIWRLNRAGTLDSGFGVDGLVLQSASMVEARVQGTIAQDSADRYVITGLEMDIDEIFGLGVWRFREDGAIDQ